MIEIKKPIWLWVVGLCILGLILVLIRDVIRGDEKVILSTADLIIFLTLAGGNFLSWHIIEELKEDLEKIRSKK